jgi:hypothetical protein
MNFRRGVSQYAPTVIAFFALFLRKFSMSEDETRRADPKPADGTSDPHVELIRGLPRLRSIEAMDDKG